MIVHFAKDGFAYARRRKEAYRDTPTADNEAYVKSRRAGCTDYSSADPGIGRFCSMHYMYYNYILLKYGLQHIILLQSALLYTKYSIVAKAIFIPPSSALYCFYYRLALLLFSDTQGI